ncbi:MAG: urate hydroxylase PuuD [Candidatus Competibacterales bacterium]|nr:urate hydroxylase PuuD [Candidatus Competibacterales bacterium]
MSGFWTEWLGLLIRWIHVITGVAWIGTSFYFNWLEGRLDRSGDKPEGVAGDLWSVHGGGFYHLQKYEVSPPRLPSDLHWFKWEAYSTWLSGFALLLVVYYLNPGARLLGSNELGLPAWTGVVAGLGMLLGSWLVYHGLGRAGLDEKPTLFAALGIILLSLLAWGSSLVFDGRAAYIHIGAVIGTLMAANVFFVIIPAQKGMVRAMTRGERVDPAPGRTALRRSTHNNYLTLPVLFIMVSNHYPATFAHQWNWVILALLAVGSAAIRHYFNLRNRGQAKIWILPVGTLVIIAGALLSRPTDTPETAVAAGPTPTWRMMQIVERHCVNCHQAQPSDPAFAAPPQGLLLDTPQRVRAAADLVHARAVATESMPLGNPTGMTAGERAELGNWLEQKPQR